AIRQQLVHDPAGIAAYQFGLATSYSNLGLFYAGRDRSTDAEAYFRKAEPILMALVREHPEDMHYLCLLGNLYDNWGRLLKETGKPQAAVDRYTQAIRTLEAVLQQEPRFHRARNTLASALSGRAPAYLALK